MKTFSEFIAESEQQSGALAAHLARTAADRASQSGTVGGTEKKFVKRPSLGLKRPTLPSFKRKDKIKDKGPRKPAPYGSGPRPQKALPGSRDDVQKVNVKVEKPAEKKPAEKKPAEKKPGRKEPAANPATDEKPAGEKQKQVPAEKGSPKESPVADSGPAQKAAQAEAVSPKEAAKPTKADKPAPQSAEPEQDKPQPVQGSKDKA